MFQRADEVPDRDPPVQVKSMTTSSSARKARVKEIELVAGKRYASTTQTDTVSVLDHLVRCIIARRSNQIQAWQFLERMRSSFVDWNEARVSTDTQFVMMFDRAPWAIEAARHVKEVLSAIYADRQEVSLEFLTQDTPTHVRNYLMKLPAVDRPLADEVMLMALKYPALPYAEDVARTAHRLGLVADDKITVRSQKSLGALFEQASLPHVHYLFQDVLRDLCLPDFGKCEDCPLIDFCPGRKKGGAKAASRPKAKRPSSGKSRRAKK